MDMQTVEYSPLNGSSYILLPKELSLKKAIINIENNDQECFEWSILRFLNPVVKDQERIGDLKDKMISILQKNSFLLNLWLSQNFKK